MSDTEYVYVVYPEITSFPTRHEAIGYAAVQDRRFELWDFEVQAMVAEEVEKVTRALESAAEAIEETVD
jgi:hypothetical protein